MFAAWRTYFERITGHGTVALLFEDLHWADSGMLDFIDHMLDWSLNVPILIVTLSRPELLDNRPGWGAGRRNFLALDLQPLDDAGMRELLERARQRPARAGDPLDRVACRGHPAVRGRDDPDAGRRRPADRARRRPVRTRAASSATSPSPRRSTR